MIMIPRAMAALIESTRQAAIQFGGRTRPRRTRAGVGRLMRASLLGALLMCAIGAMPEAFAQTNGDGTPGASAPAQGAPKTRQPAVGASQPAAKPTAKAAPKAAVETTEAPRTDGSSQLRQRIDQLEEQINEMHVTVGTLDSLAKTSAGRASSSPSSGAAAGGGGAGDGARLDGMENRMRALIAQVEQMAQQIRVLESRGRSPQDRSEAPPVGAPTRAAELRAQDARPADAAMSGSEPPAERTGADRPAGERGGDAIGGLIRGPGSDRSADVGSTSLPPIASSAPPRQQPASLSSGNPRELYERAYGSLLKQDYASAEIGFAEFLGAFPSHELSGNAQYWLGESFYVRGQFRPAANAFLKGYQSYPKSQKAPDSLLKLGMALDRLGQKDAACSSISELATRFPTAPAHIQTRAQSERARLGC